jgi:anti-anti-sigma factor
MHVIRLAGEMCLAGAPDVEDELRRVVLTSADTVVIDMRELTFIDSSGIRVILQAHRRAPKAGSRLLLVRGPRAVQRPFELTGLAERLPFVDAVVTPHAR